MATKPSLSICIPTYNRSGYLAELLDSIIAQNLPEIEVVISDDASPDDTKAVAASYEAKFKKFRYIQHPENIGLDRNFLAVIAAATGDYVWLMGDDDRLEPGGAQRVLDAFERWPGISGLTLGVIDYDPDMKFPTGLRTTPQTQVMDSVGQVFGEMADILGFMSALVVRRDAWLEIAEEPETTRFRNFYVQLYIVGVIIGRFGRWGVVHEPCVGFRTSNDQLMAKLGWVDRLKIDVVAYTQLGDVLLSKDPVAKKAMRKRIFDVHVMARLHNSKTTSGATPDIMAACRLLFKYYGDMPQLWTKGLPTLFAPNWTIRLARVAYKRFSRSSGAARARQLAAPRG